MANPWFHSNGPLWTTAVVAGIIATMLVAVIAPELFDREGPGWLVSLAAGALVTGAIIVWGFAKRHSGRQEEHHPID